jgi:hypothetical protein
LTSGALAQNQGTVRDAQLNALKLWGWELTGSYLEMETACPNSGNSDSVTSLKGNVRPQQLVLILKRPVQEWAGGGLNWASAVATDRNFLPLQTVDEEFPLGQLLGNPEELAHIRCWASLNL